MLQEVDWPVLKTLLTDLPLVLENKTLVLSAQGHLVYTICGQLCAMVMLHTTPSHPSIQSALGGNIETLQMFLLLLWVGVRIPNSSCD